MMKLSWPSTKYITPPCMYGITVAHGLFLNMLMNLMETFTEHCVV